MAQANTFAKRFSQGPYWPDRVWEQAIVLDNSAQRGDGYDELLERASWFYEAVSFSEAMKSTTPGAGQAYLDGSVDLYFGPTPPAEPSSGSSCVRTIPGRHWFSYFRLYGPLEPYFDRTWKLDDITTP